MKMKKIIFTTIIAVIIGIFLPSCESFLEEEPVDRYVTNNFYSSQSDAVAAINAIYQQLYSIYDRHMFILNELPTDDEKNGLGMPNQFLQDLEYNRYNSENQFVREMWQRNYSGISRANTAIEKVPEITMNTLVKNRLIAEARFLRALFYFNLVRFYGDVPLILKLESIDDAYENRASSNQVYDQIIEDLTFAENNLPNSYPAVDIGRVSKGAAKILLGKVYLTRKEFQKCADKLKEVVEKETDYGYGLHDYYGDNWNR